MRYLKLFEEFTGKVTDEADIVYRDKNLVIIVPKTPGATRKYSRDTIWCSNSETGFYGHHSTANLFRFHFKDGYKLRLTWDYIPYDGRSFSGGTHWGQGGKINGEEMRYTYIRPKDEENPFDFEYDKEDNRQLMVDRIKSIPNEARKKVIEYQDSHSMNKTDIINKMHTDIQSMKISNVIEDVNYRERNKSEDGKTLAIRVDIDILKDSEIIKGKCEFYTSGRSYLYIRYNDKSGASHYDKSGMNEYLNDKVMEWLKKNNIKLYNDIKNLKRNNNEVS